MALYEAEDEEPADDPLFLISPRASTAIRTLSSSSTRVESDMRFTTGAAWGCCAGGKVDVVAVDAGIVAVVVVTVTSGSGSGIPCTLALGLGLYDREHRVCCCCFKSSR